VEIEKIAVIGAGTMGNGIAQVCAASGYAVTMIDVIPAAREKGLQTIRKSLSKLAEKGRLSEEQKGAALKAITTAGELGAAAGADLLIEAATENVELKLKIFRDLDAIARPGVILASNTSSISLTKIGGATKRPDKVIGMHFMNPVPLMTLVEIIRGLAGAEDGEGILRVPVILGCGSRISDCGLNRVREIGALARVEARLRPRLHFWPCCLLSEAPCIGRLLARRRRHIVGGFFPLPPPL